MILEVEGLSVRYGAAEAVRGVSLAVAAGEAVTLIGPNGAGKTTTLLALLNLLGSSGTVRYQGQSTRGLAPEALVRRGLVLVPEKRELFAPMSVEDNLRLGAFARRRERGAADTLARVYELFPRLLERRRQLAGTLSGGEQQMLAVGRALMSRPALLMLDEPSLGLAPLIVTELFETFAKLKREGTTLLIVEQNARAALALADRGYVVETGEVALSGPARELLTDPRVVEAYLGLAAAPAPT